MIEEFTKQAASTVFACVIHLFFEPIDMVLRSVSKLVPVFTAS
jgi:hypothetical protein